MINVLLASRDKDRFSEMIDAFQQHSIKVDPVQSGAQALTMADDISYDLLICDEHLPDMTGRVLIEKAITRNPLMNCVAVSTLSPEDFHEEHEGMGVLMQFPLSPATSDVQTLLNHLDKIYSLSKK